MYDAFRGKRVLVTGDTGFKGSWLSLWLTELGADVTGYALPAEGGQPLFDLLGLARMIRHVDGDVRDGDAVRAAFAEARPEIVFHLAAQALVRRSYDEPKYTFDTNVGGAVNVLEAVRATPSVRAVVCITSDKCYRNKEWVWGYRENDELGGHDPYSASKAAAEMVIGAYIASYFHGGGAPGVYRTRACNVSRCTPATSGASWSLKMEQEFWLNLTRSMDKRGAAMDGLEGKTAFITGAASGIGLAMANAFAGAGMRLTLADIEPEPLLEAASGLKTRGAETLWNSMSPAAMP